MIMDRKLLIIDDEIGIRESLTGYFEDRDWSVKSACSGEDALLFLENERFSSVLVDIRLPGMSGEQFIQEAYKKYPDLIFVIITGSPYYCPASNMNHGSRFSIPVFSKPVKDLLKLEKALECCNIKHDGESIEK